MSGIVEQAGLSPRQARRFLDQWINTTASESAYGQACHKLAKLIDADLRAGAVSLQEEA